MTRLTHHVAIDRVIVRGAGVAGLDAAEVRALVEHAVAQHLGEASLPAGRTMRADVQITSRSVRNGGAAGIASAVASGITAATAGGLRRG